MSLSCKSPIIYDAGYAKEGSREIHSFVVFVQHQRALYNFLVKAILINAACEDAPWILLCACIVGWEVQGSQRPRRILYFGSRIHHRRTIIANCISSNTKTRTWARSSVTKSNHANIQAECVCVSFGVSMWENKSRIELSVVENCSALGILRFGNVVLEMDRGS